MPEEIFALVLLLSLSPSSSSWLPCPSPSASLSDKEEEEEEKVKTGKNFIIIRWSDEGGSGSSSGKVMDPCSFVVAVVAGVGGVVVVELRKNISVSRGG